MSIIDRNRCPHRRLLPPRSSAMRLGDLPIIPIIILAIIALMAIFANLLAPHNPEVGSLTARFHPPVWQTGGTTNTCSAPTSWAATCCRG